MPNTGKPAREFVMPIKEVVQAGDTFLMRIDCPSCVQELFVGYPVTVCPECKSNLSKVVLMLPESRTDYRLLSGTRRKYIRFHRKTIGQLMEIQDGLCAYCDRSIREQAYHIEHIIPLAFGGSNGMANLCLSCPRCNLVAGDKVFTDILHKREYLKKVV